MKIEARLKELKIELPPVPQAGGNYVHWVQTGNLLYLAGKGPLAPEGKPRPTGKVGTEVTIELAYQHARSVGLVLITVMKEALGDLDRVNRVVKVLGMVNAAPDFGDQPKVINGCSDLFVEVFGDKGRHARSAVGMGSLPSRITVEIEAIVEVK
ncbi:MAG: RidA family protein [Proteobacteria bacterium]|nr:RidA family protein [Pseudomonadota bacterium]MBI3498986.1 RidA family protein [Pseudomonadota bacterium]